MRLLARGLLGALALGVAEADLVAVGVAAAGSRSGRGERGLDRQRQHRGHHVRRLLQHFPTRRRVVRRLLRHRIPRISRVAFIARPIPGARAPGTGRPGSPRRSPPGRVRHRTLPTSLARSRSGSRCPSQRSQT